MSFDILQKIFGKMPYNLYTLQKTTGVLKQIVSHNLNPIETVSSALGITLAEFSTSMDTDWLVPTLRKVDSVGVPGDWDAVGEYLAGEFEKLRDGACRAWTLNGGAVTFYIVMEREESDTLSLWIASANKAIRENFNAAAIEQIEICDAESTGVVER